MAGFQRSLKTTKASSSRTEDEEPGQELVYKKAAMAAFGTRWEESC